MTNYFKLSIAFLVLAAALAVTWLIRRAVEAELQSKRVTWFQMTVRLDKLATENSDLSNALARTKNPSLRDDELTELLKLRNEAGQLQRALGDAEPLRREITRLRARLQDMETNAEDAIVLTASLADEMPVRRARVARLRHWLDETPSEKIPELQFVSELEWIRAVENPFVWTDDDYRNIMSNLRFKGERVFSRAAFQALQRFSQVNGGQFPTDLAQLKPYFTTPVDDAMLDRYQIVPVSQLPSSARDQISGEFVITQKTPVNRELDARVLIGSRGPIPALPAPGLWDSP